MSKRCECGAWIEFAKVDGTERWMPLDIEDTAGPPGNVKVVGERLNGVLVVRVLSNAELLRAASRGETGTLRRAHFATCTKPRRRGRRAA